MTGAQQPDQIEFKAYDKSSNTPVKLNDEDSIKLMPLIAKVPVDLIIGEGGGTGGMYLLYSICTSCLMICMHLRSFALK